jgi:hypothetical protein
MPISEVSPVIQSETKAEKIKLIKLGLTIFDTTREPDMKNLGLGLSLSCSGQPDNGRVIIGSTR